MTVAGCLRCGSADGQSIDWRYQSIARSVRLCPACELVAAALGSLPVGELDVSASVNWGIFRVWMDATEPRGWIPFSRAELLNFFYPLFLIVVGVAVADAKWAAVIVDVEFLGVSRER